MEIEIFVNPPFMENTYVLFEKNKPECLIVDPGGPKEEIVRFIEQNKLKPKAIINTHGHIDHIYGVQELKDHYNIPFYINSSERPFVEHLRQICTMYGISPKDPPTIDYPIEEGEFINLNTLKIKAIASPGHTPGGMSFYIKDAKVLFSGDTLFLGSIGRTDLPGGDSSVLKKTLKTIIESLPEDVVVYSGHGDKTTIGFEKKNNPFYRGEVDF